MPRQFWNMPNLWTLWIRTKIYAVGLSMGGAVASMLARLHSEDIAALCLWAPAGNMEN